MLRKLTRLISFKKGVFHQSPVLGRTEALLNFDSTAFSRTNQRILGTKPEASLSPSEGQAPKPAKRGRPKKIQVADNEVAVSGEEKKSNLEKKSRGRPKKSEGEASEGKKAKPKKEIDPEVANRIIKKQNASIAHTEEQIPIVLNKGRGAFVMDVYNSRFYDFDALSINHGHQNPQILKALREQLNKLTLTSRAFYNDQLGQTAEYIGKQFKYAQVLLMNSGLEGAESAIKIARKWAYEVKGVPDGQARILFAKGNCHGNSIAMLAATNHLQVAKNFGPYGGLNFDRIDYNNLEDLELTLQREPNYAAFMVEPIQTQNGVQIPDAGYLKNVKRICQKYNVLLIADELYTGLGRTGKMLASDWQKVKPDIAIIGESLGGGIYPISAVMGPKKVMKVLTPGTHGSTFGGNPLGCVIARTSLQILRQQEFLQNVRTISKTFGDLLGEIKSPLVRSTKQKGMVAGIEIETELGVLGSTIASALSQRGILARVVGENVLRLAPPLIISQGDLINGMKYVRLGIKDCEKEMDKDKAKIKMAVLRALNPQPMKPRKKKEAKKSTQDPKGPSDLLAGASQIMAQNEDQAGKELKKDEDQEVITVEEKKSDSSSGGESSSASETSGSEREGSSDELSSDDSTGDSDSSETSDSDDIRGSESSGRSQSSSGSDSSGSSSESDSSGSSSGSDSSGSSSGSDSSGSSSGSDSSGSSSGSDSYGSSSGSDSYGSSSGSDSYGSSSGSDSYGSSSGSDISGSSSGSDTSGSSSGSDSYGSSSGSDSYGSSSGSDISGSSSGSDTSGSSSGSDSSGSSSGSDSYGSSSGSGSSQSSTKRSSNGGSSSYYYSYESTSEGSSSESGQESGSQTKEEDKGSVASADEIMKEAVKEEAIEVEAPSEQISAAQEQAPEVPSDKTET